MGSMIRPDGTPYHGEMDGWEQEGNQISIACARSVQSPLWEGRGTRPWCLFPMEHKEVANKEDVPLWTFAIISDRARRAENVTHATALVYDFDGKNGVRYEEIDQNLALFGLVAYLHTTYSHTEERNAFRVILPVQEAIPADEYVLAWRAVASIYSLDGGDKSACSISRLYYTPSCAPGAPRYSSVGGTVWVPWRACSNVWVGNPKNQKSPPSTTVTRTYRPSSDELDREKKRVVVRMMVDGISADTSMQEWLEVIFSAVSMLGHEGFEVVESWSRQSNKYDARQFAHLRRRLNLV